MYARIPAAAILIAVAFPLSSLAQWWNPAAPWCKPGSSSCAPVVYTSAVREMAALFVGDAINRRDWAKIDRMYDEFLAQDLRATDGQFLVQVVQRIFADRYGAVDESMARAELADWEAKQPGSKLRPVVAVVALQAQAWKARGGKWAGATPAESMQIFREKLVAASKALAETEEAGRESPIWWWAALIVAGSSGRPEAQFDAMFAEATKRFPSYQPLYYTRVNYLLPQWGGNWERVDAFVDQSVRATAAKEGDAMYAWIYVDLSLKTDNVLTDTRVTWPRLKKSFEDLVARYPDASNKNLFATFACRARDKETTGRLLAELGANAQLGAYSQGYSTESCRRFALTAA